jgi:hypothetical protein
MLAELEHVAELALVGAEVVVAVAPAASSRHSGQDEHVQPDGCLPTLAGKL